jgi:hypothetical protein
VRALASQRRDQLDRTILAHKEQIDWLERGCTDNAGVYADHAKNAHRDGFGWYRGQLADLFDGWGRGTDRVIKKQSDRLTSETEKNARWSWAAAKAYDQQYIQSWGGQSEERKEVQHDAAYDVAEDYRTEIEKAKSDLLSELPKLSAQIKAELDKGRDQTLVEYDKGLPEVLRGVDEQLAAAQQEISGKADTSRRLLAKSATEMRARVDFLEATALQRNAAFRTTVDRQIESARKAADQQFRRAIPEAIEPIAEVVDEAVGILTNANEELDPQASRQFIDEVVDFSLDAADATGVVFTAARDASVGTLADAVPFARRGLAAGKQDLETTLHMEGAENESALILFGMQVENHLNASLTDLDAVFNSGVMAAGDKLTSVLNETRDKLREPMEKTQKDIRTSITEVLWQETLGKRALPNAMHKAARQAAWNYDHPVLKHVVAGIEVLAGFAAAILVVVALVFGLPVLLGEALAAAVLVVIGLIGAFFVGYFGAKAYYERRAKGADWLPALLGAAADVTGINDVRRAFTDPKMSPFERGLAWGGFWANLFGFAEGASRFLGAIKVRLPKKFTNPFRLGRSTVPTAALEEVHLPAVPETPALPETPKIDYQLPQQETPKPEITTTPAGSESKQIVSVPPPEQAPKPEITTTPAGSEQTVSAPPPEQAPKPEITTAPAGPESKQTVPAPPPEQTPKPEITTPPAVPEPKQIVPEPPPRQAPKPEPPAGRSDPSAPTGSPSPVISEAPPAGEIPSPQQSGAEVTGPPETATPPTSEGAAQPGQSPAKGTGVADPEPDLAPAAQPASAPAARSRQSTRSKLADKRRTETETALENARAKRAAAEARVDELEKEVDFLKKLRKELGRGRKRDYVDEAYDKARAELRGARSERKTAQKTEIGAAREADDVARARDQVREIEEKLAAIEREQTRLSQEPDPEDPDKFKGQPPRKRTEKGRTYAANEKTKADLLTKLESSTKDLTRTVAEHVKSLTPGAGARPDALENASKYPALEPVDGRPIDVTTGKPMETDVWETDHIMSKNEIAHDPRFGLLDAEGRWQMINEIPENYLPLTKSANGQKGDMTVNEWLAYRTRKNPIPSEMADALRAADKAARDAVEAKFLELVGPLEE